MSKFGTTVFSGTRVTFESDQPFESVLDDLLDDIGHEPVPLTDIARDAASWDEYQRAMAVHVGPSDFMLFALLDHGSWIGKAGVQRKATRIILGNPMIAITLIRHDLTAGLFAPVELIVYENDVGLASVDYVKPSSLLISPRSALLDAAIALDEKLHRLVEKVTRMQAAGVSDRSSAPGTEDWHSS